MVTINKEVIKKLFTDFTSPLWLIIFYTLFWYIGYCMGKGWI